MDFNLTRSEALKIAKPGQWIETNVFGMCRVVDFITNELNRPFRV